MFPMSGSFPLLDDVRECLRSLEQLVVVGATEELYFCLGECTDLIPRMCWTPFPWS